MSETLSGMSRKELQALAKLHGVPANQTTNLIIDQLSLKIPKQQIQVTQENSTGNDESSGPVSVSVSFATDSYVSVDSCTNKAKTEQSFSSKSSDTSRQYMFYFWLVLFFGLVAQIYNLNTELTKAKTRIINLEDEGAIYENTIEDMGSEKQHLIDQINKFREAPREAETAFATCQQTFSQFRDAVKQCFSNSSAAHANNSTADPIIGGQKDDEQNGIYCWLDSLFGTKDFGECRGNNVKPAKETALTCPFPSADHACQQIKLHPAWIKLQKTDRGSSDRRQMIKELSLKFHPDRMFRLGCPQHYGTGILQLVNSYR